MSAVYRVPTGSAAAELREQGSRFFAYVAPAPTVEAAQVFLEELRREHPDATHHCFAWRIGWPPAERAADAGEPSGTAGQPILRVLVGATLSDVVAVVVRWFGGTKLGKGGLARAYSGATVAALAALPTRQQFPSRHVEIRSPYDRIGAVKRLVRPPEIALVEERYGGEAILILRVGESALGGLRAALGELRLEAVDLEPRAARLDDPVA